MAFIGEIRMIGFGFAPVGWALCDGSLLPIANNTVLFSLIGTTYGGDGQSTFALPDLQGRIPLCEGQGEGLSSYKLGDNGGVEQVTLQTNQIAAHTHAFQASLNAGSQVNPTGNVPAQPAQIQPYIDDVPSVPMFGQAIQFDKDAGGQPHENLMPFLCINYVIAVEGVFPGDQKGGKG